jgi:hypothetical protein
MTVKISKIIIFFPILCLNLTLAGCLNSKLKSCRQIIAITQEVEENAKENLASQNINNILQVADSFESASQKVLKEKIKDVELAKYTQNLGNIYQDYAIITRNFITAFQQKDQEKAIFYKEEVNRLFTQQQKLVNQINNYCQ